MIVILRNEGSPDQDRLLILRCFVPQHDRSQNIQNRTLPIMILIGHKPVADPLNGDYFKRCVIL